MAEDYRYLEEVGSQAVVNFLQWELLVEGNSRQVMVGQGGILVAWKKAASEGHLPAHIPEILKYALGLWQAAVRRSCAYRT